ncbi:MAG TPA: hypothetical protein VJH03_23580 [Blastocatellia bacterium]|nr:hypothetical protein [Blastocatellia bacterium]
MKRKPRSIPTTHSEADRFKDFARKIMSVPKKEIDEKQAEYQKQRIKKGSKKVAHNSRLPSRGGIMRLSGRAREKLTHAPDNLIPD